MKRSRQYEDWEDYDAGYLGLGSVAGNITGKVKTKQIGFIRTVARTSKPMIVKKNAQPKSRPMKKR